MDQRIDLVKAMGCEDSSVNGRRFLKGGGHMTRLHWLTTVHVDSLLLLHATLVVAKALISDDEASLYERTVA